MAKKKYNEPQDTIHLDEVSVYPNTIRLFTYNPLHPDYIPGHSKVIFTSAYPELKSRSVNTSMDDPDYNLITNNCSDNTRQVLEATFGVPLDYNLFTTPGDVRDYFEERGAKVKPRAKYNRAPTTTQIMNVNREQYLRGIEAIYSINAIRRNRRTNRK